MQTVLFGCKLPHGLVLKDQNDKDVFINGLNTALVAGGFGLTHIEENTAAFLLLSYADYAPFKNNSVFTYQTDQLADVIAIADELKGEKTGFEGLNPDKPVDGLKPADDSESTLKAALKQNEAAPRPPAKKPSSKADKAAAAQLVTAINS